MPGRILAIEDDENILSALRIVGTELGMEIEGIADGRAGLALAESGSWDLLLLDLGLPTVGGTEICRQIRALKPKLPIIILTSRSDELSSVLGLELGADDYMSKPFRLAELVARIRSLFRRIHIYGTEIAHSSKPRTVGDLVVDLEKREVRKGGTPLAMSRTEFDLLAYFVLNAGVAIHRDELIENVWGYTCTGFDGTVTTYLSRLRQKIEDDPNNPRYLTTVRGIGYRFEIP